MGRYDRRNVAKRLKRIARHEARVLEELSESITHLQFIKDFEIFFFGGDEDTLHDEYVVHFKLNNSILLKHFTKVIKNKMKGVINE